MSQAGAESISDIVILDIPQVYKISVSCKGVDHGQVLLQRQGQGADDWAHQSYMSQRENHRERDNIVCPYHVLAQDGDGKQVDRGYQIHHVIDGEEVVEWGVYLLRTRQVGWVAYHGVEPGTVARSHLYCNHLTKASSECKDHTDKSSCQCTGRSNRKHQYFQGEKSRIIISSLCLMFLQSLIS